MAGGGEATIGTMSAHSIASRLYHRLVAFGRADQARETARIALHVAEMRSRPLPKADRLPFVLDYLALFTRYLFTSQ